MFPNVTSFVVNFGRVLFQSTSIRLESFSNLYLFSTDPHFKKSTTKSYPNLFSSCQLFVSTRSYFYRQYQKSWKIFDFWKSCLLPTNSQLFRRYILLGIYTQTLQICPKLALRLPKIRILAQTSPPPTCLCYSPLLYLGYIYRYTQDTKVDYNTGRWGVDWSGLRYVSSVNVVLIWDISVTFGCISPAGYNV